MIERNFRSLLWTLICVIALLALCACAPQKVQKPQRFFWPPPPGEAKIEYLNYYFSDADLQRGVDRRIENAILGSLNPDRLITRPYSIASDGKGRIFVGDFAGRMVTVLDRQAHNSRQLVRVPGAPQKVLVDKTGEIWVLDGVSMVVYHYAVDEKLITETKLAGMSRASSLAVDSDRQRLYLTDTPNHRICVYDYQGTLLKSYGDRGVKDGQFNYPTDLDLDNSGNLYIVDSMNARIQILTSEGVFIRSFGERGTESGSFSSPKGVAVSPGQIVYVTDANQNKVVIFNSNGDYLFTLGGRDVYDGKNIHPGGFHFPSGIDVDANETIFIADLFNGIVHEFQYLTPEFLSLHPIRPEEVYTPHAVDMVNGAETALPPVTAPALKKQ